MQAYYAVCFFEEAILHRSAGWRMIVAMRIVFLEKVVEDWGYFRHWMWMIEKGKKDLMKDVS